MKKPPRIPMPVTALIAGTRYRLQVNHCRMPDCENFGIPARHHHGKPGPSSDRDPHYRVQTTKKGKVPSIRCKSCSDNPPLKSNQGISAEIERLTTVDGLRNLTETRSCSHKACSSHRKAIATHPELYRKAGHVAGYGQRYQCKACGSKLLLSHSARLHQRHRALALDIFSRIGNKSPVRGTIRGAGLVSNSAYYSILGFLRDRCQAYSGSVDRALMDGRLTLPTNMNIESDAQIYTLNWSSRLDRRNIELSCYCTVDSDSRFILGMHSNFDEQIDPFAINQQAARDGDMEHHEPFRRYAQYWLAGDELRAGRSLGRPLRGQCKELTEQIQSLYAKAKTRSDVENIELDELHPEWVTPFLDNGMQVHMPYTVYAHWFLLHRLLSGAGVQKVHSSMDIDSMGRAAFLCAFSEEIKRSDATGFFVRYTKYQTIDERRRIMEESRALRYAFEKTLPSHQRHNLEVVSREMMKAQFAQGQEYGQWRDVWYRHPLPSMNEPDKAVCALVPMDGLSEDARADQFLQAGLARIDNTYQMTRRLMNAFERPVGTSSGHNRVWHGYAPYNPALVQTYLTLFRVMNNFILVGKDGATPAMRLGIAKQPLGYGDILWPGQQVPRPRRQRRKGLQALAA